MDFEENSDITEIHINIPYYLEWEVWYSLRFKSAYNYQNAAILLCR